MEDRRRKNKVIEKVLEKCILYLTKNLKIERAVDIYDEDLFKANVGNENLEKEMEKAIELVEVGKASEAVYDLGESLMQICEIRKEKKSTKKFFDYECVGLRLIVQETMGKVESSQLQGIENNLRIYRENRKR
ncbi:hypothetical protein QYM36_013043 [Artemia franciscana]|uniref:Uncharacterized protein n=1 Tax=Artemia franciscana TaxID=6661 RepID=A0AA88L609_ARTSF|nr:hypothetical protein QYM36_013043 [Artemia franciscana]